MRSPILPGSPSRLVSNLGALVLATFALVPAPTSAQATGQITGLVRDAATGTPIASVQVHIPGTGLGALTQANGRYLILDVPAGSYEVRAERIGYRTVASQVTVTGSGSLPLDFQMDTEALGLDEIVVTGNAGCSLQLQAQLKQQGRTVPVMHPLELLDLSYQNQQPGRGPVDTG